MIRIYFLFLYLLFLILAVSCEKSSKIEGVEKENTASYLQNLEDSARFFSRKKVYDSAIFFSNKLLKQAVRSDSLENQGKAYFFKAFAFRKLGKVDSSILNYHKSINIYKKLSDSAEIVKKLLNLANIYAALDNYAAVDEAVLDALKFKNDSIGSSYIAGLYNAIGNSKADQSLFSEALYYYEKGLKELGGSKEQFILENNIATIYAQSGDYDKAFEIYSSLEKNNEVQKDTLKFLQVRDNHEYYKWLNDENYAAESQLEDILRQRIKKNDIDGEIASYDHLSEIYLAGNQNSKALNYSKKLYDVSYQLKDPYYVKLSLERLVKLSPEREIKPYFQKYIKLNDSIEEQSKISENQYNLIRYDTEKTRVEAAKMEKENLQKSKQAQLYSLVALSLFVLFLAFLIYYFNRKKLDQLEHEKEISAKIQQTERENAIKVHDELANDAHQLLQILQNDKIADQKEKLLRHSANLYRKSRDLSYEMQPIDLNEDFGMQIKNLANAYAQDIKIILNGWNEDFIDKMKADQKMQLYRSIQELLTNMKKHSGANMVILSAKREDESIVISYSDNGIGFEKNEEFSSNGLANVENRVRSIFGSITFENKNGLKIKITIPI